MLTRAITSSRTVRKSQKAPFIRVGCWSCPVKVRTPPLQSNGLDFRVNLVCLCGFATERIIFGPQFRRLSPRKVDAPEWRARVASSHEGAKPRNAEPRTHFRADSTASRGRPSSLRQTRRAENGASKTLCSSIAPICPLLTYETEFVCLLKFQITRQRFSPIEHLCRLRDTKTRN